MQSRNRTKGFSLVELLAVVLILSVLAAVAIPLYINTRRSSAARACKANIAEVASACSAFALRNGQYPAIANVLTAYNAANPVAGGIIGAPEGITASVSCPLDGKAYVFTNPAAGALQIQCFHATTAPGDGAHVAVVGSQTADDWTVVLAAPAQDKLP